MLLANTHSVLVIAGVFAGVLSHNCVLNQLHFVEAHQFCGPKCQVVNGKVSQFEAIQPPADADQK